MMQAQLCFKSLIGLVRSRRVILQLSRNLVHCNCLHPIVAQSLYSCRDLPKTVLWCKPSRQSIHTQRRLHCIRNDGECRQDSVKHIKYRTTAPFYASFSTRDSRDDDEYTALAKRIIAATRKVDIMVDTLPQADVIDLVCELCALDFEMKDIRHLLSKRLWLLRSGHTVVSIARLIKEHGLDAKVTFKLMNHLPPHYSEDKQALAKLPAVINQFLMELRQYGVLEPKQIIMLLSRSPLVMLGEASVVPEAIEKMKEMFHVSQAKQMIVKCPNLLTDDWEESTDKYNYAMVLMGYHQKDIVKSALFVHSIEHIQDRHLFFSRTGNFYEVKPKDDPDLNPNPELKYIIDSNNENFVKHCGDISLDQYLAFLEIREKERELEDDSDFSEDSDG